MNSLCLCYKLYGSNKIFTIDLIVDCPGDFEKTPFNEKAHDAISYTWNVTKKLTASQLSAWSHKDGSPWPKVYLPDERAITIDNNSIKEYFEGILAVPANV